MAFDPLKNADRDDQVGRFVSKITNPNRPSGRDIATKGLAERPPAAPPKFSAKNQRGIPTTGTGGLFDRSASRGGRMPQRVTGGQGGDGTAAAGSLLGGDPVKTVGDNDSQEVRLGSGVDSPTPIPFQQNSPDLLGPEVGAQANQTIAQTQALRNQRNSVPDAPAPQRFGAFDSSGAPIESKGGTFNVTDNTLGGKSIVQRAQEFSAQRRSRSPLRQSLPQKTPFQQRKEQKARDKFRRDILANAGAGPGKDISLRAALGAIAQFEGQQLDAETARRGQDIAAGTADLNRQARAETASNAQRIREQLGMMELGERQASRAQDQAQFEAGETRSASEFAENLGLKDREIAAGQQAAGLEYAAEALKQGTANRKNVSTNLGKILGDLVQVDPISGNRSFSAQGIPFLRALQQQNPDIDITDLLPNLDEE